MQTESVIDPANIVRAARSTLNFSQRKFAERVGSRQSLICKYESGIINPPAPLLIQCMNLAGMTPKSVSEEELLDLVRERLAGPTMSTARQAIAQLIDVVAVSSKNRD